MQRLGHHSFLNPHTPHPHTPHPHTLTDGALGEVDASDRSSPGADESTLWPQATHRSPSLPVKLDRGPVMVYIITLIIAFW